MFRLIWKTQNKIENAVNKALGLDDPYYPSPQKQQEMKYEIYERCQNTLEEVFEEIKILAQEAPQQQISAAKEVDGEFIWYNEYGEKIKDCLWRYVNIRMLEKDLQSHSDINHDIHQMFLHEDIVNTSFVAHGNEKERSLNPQKRNVILIGKFNPLPQKDVVIMSCNGNFYNPSNKEVDYLDFPSMTIVRRK